MNSLKIFVGLGNPGIEYKNTYHNLGFIFCDVIASSFDFPKPVFKDEFFAFYSEKEIFEKKVILLWPTTFMNLSGKSVRRVVDVAGVDLKNLFVVHDDLAFLFGTQKIKFSGSSAGHNGIQSIIDTLGTKDFYRIRLGIKSANGYNLEMKKFVLEKIVDEKIKIIKNNWSNVWTAMFETLVKKDVNMAMNIFNQKKEKENE